MKSVPTIVASRNAKKIGELRALLSDYLELRELPNDAPEVEEDADSFEGNADKKAREIAIHYGSFAIADDSGLCVDALSGAPGVYSARYSGESATDETNNTKLLSELAGITKRSARFVCVLSISDPQGRICARVRGECEGHITQTPSGNGGFGYDPLFRAVGASKNMAELSPAEKHALSHRGHAVKALLQWFVEGGTLENR